MKPFITPIAIIISGIVIAISIVVSTKMYIDANKYTFVIGSDGFVKAYNQEGIRFNEDRKSWYTESKWGYGKKEEEFDKLP